MRITDFDIYKELLRDKSGLMIDQDQCFLLDSRLVPIAKKWGYTSLEAMTASLHAVPDNDLVHDVIEVMTAKDTSFFKDTWPFRMLSDEIFPYLKKNRGDSKKIRLWSCASSTGQEPYSACLLFAEKGTEFSGWKPEVLASDISASALEQSKQAIYSQFEVQRGVPVRLLLKHFKQIEGENWQISPEIRRMVRHQSFNLIDTMTALGKFDVIFCRNVLTGFEPDVRAKTIEKLCGRLEKDGFLIFGKGEKPDSPLLRPLHEKRGVYVLKDGPHRGSLAKNAD